MKHLCVVLIFLLVTSCLDSKPKDELVIVYKFENNEISNVEKQKTIKVLKDRFSVFGVTNPSIGINSHNNIEIKTTTDLQVKRINKLVENQGKLEFWEVFNPVELNTHLYYSNDLLKKKFVKDTLSLKPFLDKVFQPTYSFGALFSVSIKDTLGVITSIASKEARSVLPSNYRYVKYIYGIPNDDGNIPLYGIKGNRENKAPITQKDIIDAKQSENGFGHPAISIKMSKKGALKWERITEKAYQNQTQIAITLNNIVYSAPRVNSGAIRGGFSEISGNFSLEEAQNFAVIFSSKESIPKLKFVKSSVTKLKEE